MTLKRSKPARVNGTGLGNSKAVAACSTEYPTFALFTQAPVDIVDLLTARSRVAASTVRAHVEAFGLGGRQ